MRSVIPRTKLKKAHPFIDIQYRMHSPFEPSRLTFIEYLITLELPELFQSTPTNELLFSIGRAIYTSFHTLFMYVDYHCPFGFDPESWVNYALEYMLRSYHLPSYTINIQWFSFFVLVGYVIHFCLSQIIDVHYNLNMYVLSELYKLVYNLIGSYLKEKYMYLFPFFFFLFNFILFFNLFGLFPFSFALTSHLSITFCLALIRWIGTYLKGISIHGFSYFKMFVLAGIPSTLVLMLVVTELLSYTVRIFSLSLRLFANLVAGHILLHVLINTINVIDFNCLLGSSLITTSSSIIVFAVLTFLILFETAVACLQAYIFIVLTVIYIRDILSISH